MKLFEDTRGITTTMIILGLLVLAVVGIAIMGLAPAIDEVPDEEAPVAVAGQETGSFDLTLSDLEGTLITSDTDLKVYLTSPDVYADVYEAYDTIDRQGRLVDPYDAEIAAGSKRSTPDANGVVSFTVTSKTYTAGDEIETGSDFGIVIIDDGVAIGDYNPEVGKVKINARLNDELTVIATVVEGVSGFMGSEIELAPRGNISFYDTLSGDDNMASYTLDTSDNESIEDEEFDVNVRLNGDDTELRDITVYVEVADNVASTAALSIDDVEIKYNGVKIVGTTLSEVSDLRTDNPLRKNAPSYINAEATSVLYVVEDGNFDLTRINEDNLDTVVITIVDYDADMTAATTDDECQFVVTLIASNGHKDSEMAGDDFIILIDEDAAASIYTAE